MIAIFHFTTLFLLMLVTGVFWGLWISLSRSYQDLSLEELIHIGKIIIKNLAMPMRILSINCLALLIISAGLHKTLLNILAIIFILAALLITLLIEVPINNQITTTAPPNWQNLRDRWQFYNIIRVISALASFACYAVAIIMH